MRYTWNENGLLIDAESGEVDARLSESRRTSLFVPRTARSVDPALPSPINFYGATFKTS